MEAHLDSLRHPQTIGRDQALKVKALRDTKDYQGNDRKDGEEWLVTKRGFYIHSINEEVIEKVNPITITETQCIHMQALQTFTDAYGVQRKAGQEYLITSDITPLHLLDVREEFLA